MHKFHEFQRQIFSLLEMEFFDEAEGQVDMVVELGDSAAATVWNMPEPLIPVLCSMLYNNIGMHRLRRTTEMFKRDRDKAALHAGALEAQGCHNKAMDRFDIAAEDILDMSDDTLKSKNFIFTLWGLGLTSYFLDQSDAARRYLSICLRVPAEDEQAATWHSDASNYLHKIEKEPAQVVIKVEAAEPILEEEDLWRVRGKLVSWDAYARPSIDTFKVYVDPLDTVRLTGLGSGTSVQWVGRTLVLRTGPSCDLFAPLSIVEVH